MFSTCLFCHRSLGTNEVLEVFPVGRRLAFDPLKGRLWVVCRHCGRWNLTPLEERWEAVEHCERMYRGTRLRASTENIGLARVAEGTELVRVGRPARPELAAWRYGDQFGRRHRRDVLGLAAASAASVALIWTGAYAAFAAAVPGGMFILQVPTWVQIYHQKRHVIARGTAASGAALVVRGRHLRSARLLASEQPDAPWVLRIGHEGGTAELQGTDAIRFASKLLTRINRVGAGRAVVQNAVDRLEYEGGSAGLFAAVAARPEREPSEWVRWRSGVGRGTGDDPPGTLRSLAVADRLALEMATHEESERRALEGELRALEEDWREAEEIAAIADDLLLPPFIDRFIREHRRV